MSVNNLLHILHLHLNPKCGYHRQLVDAAQGPKVEIKQIGAVVCIDGTGHERPVRLAVGELPVGCYVEAVVGGQDQIPQPNTYVFPGFRV